jgi:hypothetical protein
MNPEIVRLFPHQGEKHFEPHGRRELFTFERERREQLPFDQGQGVDFGVHNLFSFRPGDDGTTRAKTSAKGHQLAHSDDNLLVLEFASPFGFLVFAQCVIKRHEQAEAGRVNVLARYHLVFDQTFFPDVFIGPIRGD